MSKLTQIMEQRAKLHADAVVVMNAEQTVETRTQVTKMLADVEVLSQDIANIQRADKMAADFAKTSGAIVDPTPESQRSADVAKEYRAAWHQYMQFGRPMGKGSIRGGIAPEVLNTLETTKANFMKMSAEQRDQQAGTQSITYSEGNLGGYFVPAGFVQDIEKATKFYANLLDGNSIRIMETATGNVLPYPTSNDCNEAWTLLSETTQVVDNGTTPNYPSQGVTAPTANPGNVLAGSVSFGAYKGTTGLVRVSLELMQDSAFSLEAFLKEAFAVRLGRGYEWYLTQGTNSNQPWGLVPAVVASGVTGVTAAGQFNSGASTGNTGANSIGYADLVNLIHSVD